MWAIFAFLFPLVVFVLLNHFPWTVLLSLKRINWQIVLKSDKKLRSFRRLTTCVHRWWQSIPPLMPLFEGQLTDTGINDHSLCLSWENMSVLFWIEESDVFLGTIKSGEIPLFRLPTRKAKLNVGEDVCFVGQNIPGIASFTSTRTRNIYLLSPRLLRRDPVHSGVKYERWHNATDWNGICEEMRS